MRTVEDCLRDGFQALLRGDTDERDRQCKMAVHIHDQEIRTREGAPSPVEMTMADGIVLPDEPKP
jgi:hypothetical protein